MSGLRIQVSGGGRIAMSRSSGAWGLKPDAFGSAGAHNGAMDPREAMDPHELDALSRVFSEQLLACLDECARGRRGLFSAPVGEDEKETTWVEAARLRELALALQSLRAQEGERNALCDEFLELCTIHGESHPGERKLARIFLERIERGEVGAPSEEKKLW